MFSRRCPASALGTVDTSTVTTPTCLHATLCPCWQDADESGGEMLYRRKTQVGKRERPSAYTSVQ